MVFTVSYCQKSTLSRPSRKAPQHLLLPRCPRGYWCKKVKGKLQYFGTIESDPQGEAARLSAAPDRQAAER